MLATLSLQQTPPISVPMRFFLTAPLFGMLAAVWLFFAGSDAFVSRWNSHALALSHVLAIGVLSMVMFGALFQMMPVLVGITLNKVRVLAGTCHSMLALGTLALATGFWAEQNADHAWLFFRLALVLLGVAFLFFLLIWGQALLRAPLVHDNVRGMRWVAFSLLITITMGLMLGYGHAALDFPLWRGVLTDLHLTWGVIGWMSLLIAVVSWQVVPMFQMTPAYPPWLRRFFAPTLVAILFTHAIAQWFQTYTRLPALLLAIGLLCYALSTLHLLHQRRRKIGDASLWFWRLGASLLVACCLLGVLSHWWPLGELTVLLMLTGWVLSIINAMLLKIVPFLVWLHLQQRVSPLKNRSAKYPLPNIKTLLSDSLCTLHFAVHVCALLLLLSSFFWPALVRVSAVLWFAHFALLGYLLTHAMSRYRFHARAIDILIHEERG